MKKNNWIVTIFTTTFLLSIVFSYATNIISVNANNIVTTFLIILIIAIGILFDMIGAACLTSKEKTFHAMGAQKIKGAKMAIKLIRNNVKVSSIYNDIVGDICGIISGGLGAVLAINLSLKTNINITIITIIISAIISALTVGGKAIFKNVGVKKADKIIFNLAKILSIFTKK